MKGVRAFALIPVLLALFLAAGCAAYCAYFRTPDIPEAAPSAPPPPTAAKRALLFIIDAFAADPQIDPAEMPVVSRLGREGAHGVARTSSMSLTAPCVYSLGTGRPGTLVLGILDFAAPPAHVESLPRLALATGKRVALSGDPSWDRQFGWLLPPEDRHSHPEPGITLDARVRVADRGSVEFILPKLRDPRYGLVVVHLSTADAVGHVVTPFGAEYRDALRFIDGLVAEALGAVDDQTVVLVTGDHGMGPRGTHGGRDDSATLTPYVLWGPGVRAGAGADLPQTALPTTIAALIGLPLPAAGENPPATELMAIPPADADAMGRAFLDRKLTVARGLEPDVSLPADLDLATANARLNVILFASSDAHVGWRVVALLLFALAATLALMVVRNAMTAAAPQPALASLVAGALAVPVAFAGGAALLIEWRSALPFQPDVLAAVAATLLAVGAAVVAAALYRSPAARGHLARLELPLYFAASTVLVTPLLTSGWTNPQKYFQALAIVLVGAGMVAIGRTQERRQSLVSGWVSMSMLSAGFYSARLPSVAANEGLYLLAGAITVLVLALASLRTLDRSARLLAAVVLLAGALSALGWKLSGGILEASAMLVVFLAGIACAAVVGRDPVAAAGVLIGVSTSLAITLASDAREALVFLAAGVAALCLTHVRLPLARPRALYFAALAALALRVSLYFALGDEYNLSSIRTAPGFRMVEQGLPLALVIAILLLKYTIPWLLIFAAALPSLETADDALPRRVVLVLALGYAARFVALATVTDPFRILPHGMEGLVGLFAISWAELLTFAGASAVLLTLTSAGPARLRTTGAQPATR